MTVDFNVGDSVFKTNNAATKILSGFLVHIKYFLTLAIKVCSNY